MKIKFSTLVEDVRGKSGNAVVKKVNGKYIVASTPTPSGKPPSAGQQEVQDRLADANDYADEVQLRPDLLALYEKAAEASGKSVRQLCRNDWYKAPRITRPDFTEYYGQVGDRILFKVRDVVGASKAIVTLCDEETGELIEKGLAVQEIPGTSQWVYTAMKAVQPGVSVVINVDAYDYPGNKTHQSGTTNV